MVIKSVGSTWSLRGLEAGKELTAWNLAGEGGTGRGTRRAGALRRPGAAPTGRPRCTPTLALTFLAGGGFGEHCDRVW